MNLEKPMSIKLTKIDYQNELDITILAACSPLLCRRMFRTLHSDLFNNTYDAVTRPLLNESWPKERFNLAS